MGHRLWDPASVPVGCCHEAEQEHPAHPAALWAGLFAPSMSVLIILQQAEEHIFSFKLLYVVGGKHPTNPVTVFQVYCIIQVREVH